MSSSDSTYEITVIHFRNCFAEGPPSNISVSAKSSSLGKGSSLILMKLPTSGTGVPILEPSNMYNCTNSFNSLCFEEYVYRGMWTSSGRAKDWIFSVDYCCRPNYPIPLGSANLNNGGNMHMESGLNNLDFPDAQAKNCSPFWHNRRPNHPGHLTDTLFNSFFKTLCAGNYYTLDQSVREYQGDSVTYSFYHPQGLGGAKTLYINGYTLTDPMPTQNGPLKINPHTGMIPVIPDNTSDTGTYIVGIEAKEWRNDTILSGGKMKVIPKMIGYVRRELSIWISDTSDCRHDSLHIKDIYLDTTNADKKLTVYFNNGIAGHPNSLVRCASLSSDGSEFRIVDSSTYVPSNPSSLKYIGVVSASWACQAGLTDHVVLTLTESFKCGNYSIFLKKGTDLDVIESECGFLEPENSSAEIFRATKDPVNLGPDKVVCKEYPVSVRLKAPQGYATYYWDTWDSTRIVTVHYARKYGVVVTDNFGCESRDTIEVLAKKCNSTGKVTRVPGGGVSDIDRYNGLEEIERDIIKIYPNPTAGRILISMSDITSQEQVILSDLSGKNMDNYTLDYSASGIEIDLTAMTKGFYILQVISEGKLLLTEKVLLTGAQ